MNKNIFTIGALILLVALPLVAVRVAGKSPAAQTEPVHLVGAEEFARMHTQVPDAVVVDVRTPEEYDAGHIPGAINVDFRSPSFGASIGELDPTKTYLVYCRSGNRSGQATALMHSKGFSSVYDLSGGVVAAPQLLGQ